ncbi:MAG: right-handed parallel beta-helix repeat-containing protein [Acholeplasmatales bacterium]|nr:right-handed parallel beta-helix repeat-containing protein [Acholeplasmatales bacterium]
MKKKIKFIPLIAAALIGVTALASCGGSEKASSGAAASASSSSSAATEQTALRTIYVAPGVDTYTTQELADLSAATVTGDASVDGTDPSKPTTFLQAVLNAQAGDLILIKAGTYHFNGRLNIGQRLEGAVDQTVVEGTVDHYINVQAESDDAEVVFEFHQESADANRGIQLYSDYWHFKNIDICGAGDNGMYVSGSHNIIENCDFYNNQDTGLQIGRAYSSDDTIDKWPVCNLIKNCTSFANYDERTYGENADGFAAKLTVGYGNVFDGCIAFRNSDDGWDLFAKVDSGDIGTIVLYNCVSFENGFLPYQHEREDLTGVMTYDTLNGDGIGFKLGGSTMKGNVIVKNSTTFDNKLHGVGDNSNPGVIQVSNLTAYNNCAGINEDGTISDTRGLDGIQNKSNNIDLARTVESYNSYYGILSYINNQKNYTMANDSFYNGDSFRGSTAYSIFNTEYSDGEKYVAFTGWEDGSSYRTATEDTAFSGGVEYEGLSDDDFVDLSVYNAEVDDNSNATLKTLGDSINAKMRNADRSVNTGDHLALANETLKTYADGNPIGAVLNKSSWDEYEHYDMIDFSTNTVAYTDDQVNVLSAASMLEVITREEATYQDFRLVKVLHSAGISWTSSNTDVVSIETEEEYSVSNSVFSWARVTSPDTDTKVVLTAHITSNYVAIDKTFEITVKGRNQTLGELESTGSAAIRVNLNGSFIAPRVYALDNSAITVSELGSSLYDLTYTIKFATDGNSTFYTVASGVDSVEDYVTTSVPGVFEVTALATLKSDTKYTEELTYRVYVVDPDCAIDFTGDETISLSQDGFVVSGSLSNIEGDVVAVSSTTPLTLNTAADILALDTETYNVQKVQIETDSIVAEFEADNGSDLGDATTQYYLYYAVVNANRSNASTNAVKSSTIKVETINSESEFYYLARNGKTNGGSSSATTIYSLTKDLDFSKFDWAISASATEFTGLFRGNGHKISNITVDASDQTTYTKTVNVFYKVSNGTIMDVYFDNINLTASATTGKQVAIIGEIQGAYINNVHATRISAYGKEAIGGVVGQATGGYNYISECSLVNPIPEFTPVAADDAYTFDLDQFNTDNQYKIHANNKYAGGILGNGQKNNDQDFLYLSVTNCYVNAVIGDGADAAGNHGLLIGRVKNESAAYTTVISQNIVYGLVISKGQYNAGIVGDFDNGSGNVYINRNVADVEFMYSNMYYNALLSKYTATLTYAHKNSNPIVGRAVSNPAGSYTTTSNYGSWKEYYSSYIISSSMVFDLWDEENNTVYTWTQSAASTVLELDFENIWSFDATTATFILKALEA